MSNPRNSQTSALFDVIQKSLQQLEPPTPDSQTLTDKLAMIIKAAKVQRQTPQAAHMTPVVNDLSAIAQLLAALHQGNLLSAERYPELRQLEQDVMAFFCPLFGQTTGHATHGGSYGNLDALWQARKKYGDRSRRIYASTESHYSLAKACDILELDLQLIPVNALQKIDLKALSDACKQHPPMAIVATAGTTSSGQIDDISAIKALCQNWACWLHVDAAWGGFLSLIDNSPLTKPLLGQADSVCFDPHKSLGQPRPCGLLLYQQPVKNTASATHYLSETPRDSLPGSYGAELLLPLWLTINTLGHSGLADQLNRQLNQSATFTDFIHYQAGWWVQNSPSAIVCFTPPASKNLSSLIEQGVFSLTKLNEKTVYRAVFANPDTLAESLIRRLEPYL